VVLFARGCWHGFNNTRTRTSCWPGAGMGAGSIEDSGYEVDPTSTSLSIICEALHSRSSPRKRPGHATTQKRTTGSAPLPRELCERWGGVGVGDG